MPPSTANRNNPRSQAETLLNELTGERDIHADAASGLERATRAMKLAQQIGWREGMAFALLQIARRQEPSEAHDTLRRAIGIFRRLRHAAGEADALNNLALVYRHDGQCTVALHFLGIAHQLMQEVDGPPPYDHALLLLNLAAASFEQNSSDAALAIAGESADLCRRHGLDGLLARARWMTGRALWREGLDQLALHYETEALELITGRSQLPWDRAETEAAYAGVALDTGKDHEAREHGLRAAEMFDHLHNDHERGIALLILGIANMHLADSAEARRWLEEALALGASAGSERIRACALRVLGDLFIRTDDLHTGMARAGDALDIGERCDDRVMQGLAHAVLYRGARKMGDLPSALHHLEHALALTRGMTSIDQEPRFGDLPIQAELEALWKRQAIYRMALPSA